MTDRRKKKKWVHKLRNKYKLVIMNDETYEERFSFRLSRMNVFVATGIISIIMITLTTLLIAFTPLREYIPGYTDVSLYSKLYRMESLADSLDTQIRQKNQFLENLRLILEGKDTVYSHVTAMDTMNSYDNITITHSREDSLLRAEFENQNDLGDYQSRFVDRSDERNSLRNFTFFTPLRGIVTNHFNPAAKHYGIDVVSTQSEAVKATLDGVVIFTGWTLETGYVIGIQHAYNIFSVYKHNSALLKEQGTIVVAGDPIAVVGTSGEYSTGPHMHFEIWYNGLPINPEEIIRF